jgi:hypothetical protein
MASVELSRRVGKVVGYPPLCEMSDLQRRELHEALLDADSLLSVVISPWPCSARASLHCLLV